MQDSINLPLPANLPDLSDQVALITGTTSGLGRRFAWLLGHAGAKIILTGRRQERLIGLREKLEKANISSVSFSLDVTEPDDIDRVVREAEEVFGPISLLINNAGINQEGKAIDLTPTAFDNVMNTNVRGAFFMSQTVARSMSARGEGGRIINIASIGGFTVLPGLATYCMSKAAVIMMTKSLAREWARERIQVNAICPGYIETEINHDWFQSDGGKKQISRFPMKRLGTEADLDELVLLLSNPSSRFLTGSIITADDGQSLS